MRKLKSPDMKLPEIKTPQFLTDLVRDLRERRLLPLIVVLVVAIVAVPIALSKSESQPVNTAKSGLPASAIAATASHLTVVPDTPGLRDYHRRLRNLSATDPFVPHAPAGSSQPDTTQTQSSATAASSSSASTTSSPSGATADNGSTTSETETSVVHTETKYFSYAIDVRVVNTTSGGGAATSDKSNTSVRRNLPTLTKLPSRKTPAVVFMGVSADAKKAILLVSSNVQSAFGDGRCVLGSQDCQLLALEPGAPETFVYGADGRTFRIQVLKIHLLITNRPHRAPLGAPQSGN